jgi:hypothetical protein
MKTWKENSRLPFRATELPKRSLRAVLGAAFLVCAAGGVGCEKTTAGTAIRGGGTVTRPSFDPAEPVPGVETTLPNHIPPFAVTCLPQPAGGGRLTMARVSDPAAPKVMVILPDGWSSPVGTGDTALTLTGPDGMSGAVTIADTGLEPGGAFLKYAVDMRDSRPGVKFTVAAAQFCGYSSQQLTGTFQSPSGTFGFADRITHIWTNTKKYLVAIQLQGPAGAAGFDAAKSTLLQEFAVVIP